jgi:hypothetical protein
MIGDVAGSLSYETPYLNRQAEAMQPLNLNAPTEVVATAIEQVILSLVVLAQCICTFDLRVRRMRREEEVNLKRLELQERQIDLELYHLECASPRHLRGNVDLWGVTPSSYHYDATPTPTPALPLALEPICTPRPTGQINSVITHLDHAGEVDEFDVAVATAHELTHETARIGRNEPCWCGSGKKFKRCHGT